MRLDKYLIIIAILFVSTVSFGKIIYVDDDAAGANDGSSWQNAYIYLQDALADANSSVKPVEIRVAQGIYKQDKQPEIETLHSSLLTMLPYQEAMGVWVK